MDDQTYQLIGAALEVHIELGCGFLEPVYQEALELEVGDRGIPFCPQAAMPTVRKETKTKNLRNLCNLRIFPNSLLRPIPGLMSILARMGLAPAQELG